ncbi:hypothetical protein ACH518_03135 [Methylomonas sp. HW2-6]|uniref:hypothetical protein n=1 Tax=Methylomonas sp. HW2-6 TaxID=3376687 RepID=UPI004041D62B
MIPSFVDVPFQISFFLAASVLNLILGTLGIVGASINLGVRIFATESAILNQKPMPDKPLVESLRQAIDSELQDLSERQPLGKVVGILERQLYLYGMVTQIHAFIGAILLFKAFSGWLTTQAKDSPEGKSMKTLARFYSYAIGNFLSLTWALIIFEALRWMVQTYPPIKSLLWL